MYDAVLFDLFTALLDSQPLWREVAGSAAVGASWREECSRLAYSAGPYRPFVEIVSQGARLAGVPPARAADLLRGMGEQLGPWPEAPEVLRRLSEQVRIGVVTNCSEELGHRAAARVGVNFDTVVTAEAAGAYKPSPSRTDSHWTGWASGHRARCSWPARPPTSREQAAPGWACSGTTVLSCLSGSARRRSRRTTRSSLSSRS